MLTKPDATTFLGSNYFSSLFNRQQAQLYYAGQSRYIGVFESREKATLAYEIAREILKGGKSPSAPGEAAEKAVEAARKAAFEGVNESRPLAILTARKAAFEGVNDARPLAILTADLQSQKTPPQKTPSTTASSAQSDGTSYIRALKAAEILKAIGQSAISPAENGKAGLEDGVVEQVNGSSGTLSSWIQEHKGTLPAWVENNRGYYGEEVVVAEWELMDYRANNGWKGRDLVHDDDSPVRILQYFAKYGNGIGDLERGGEGTTLTGIVHFTPKAESHQGLCHGGSMTAVLDDVVGWVAFLATGTCQPWTGFTVQVNTALKKPVPVDSWLLVYGTITKVEGRKVSVFATIVDPENGDAVHAEVQGLVILNAGVLPGT